MATFTIRYGSTQVKKANRGEIMSDLNPTLSERNEAQSMSLRTKVVFGGNYIVQEQYMVGQVGLLSLSKRNHILLANVVTGYGEGFTPDWAQLKIGDVYSAAAPCDTKTAHIGKPNPFLDTKDVNCKKCLKLMGVI